MGVLVNALTGELLGDVPVQVPTLCSALPLDLRGYRIVEGARTWEIDEFEVLPQGDSVRVVRCAPQLVNAWPRATRPWNSEFARFVACNRIWGGTWGSVDPALVSQLLLQGIAHSFRERVRGAHFRGHSRSWWGCIHAVAYQARVSYSCAHTFAQRWKARNSDVLSQLWDQVAQNPQGTYFE